MGTKKVKEGPTDHNDYVEQLLSLLAEASQYLVSIPDEASALDRAYRKGLHERIAEILTHSTDRADAPEPDTVKHEKSYEEIETDIQEEQAEYLRQDFQDDRPDEEGNAQFWEDYADHQYDGVPGIDPDASEEEEPGLDEQAEEAMHEFCTRIAQSESEG